MTSPVLFNYYLKNVFKFPKEIKHDIIYCQRALKSHIRVHQRLLDFFQKKENMDSSTRKYILDDIETSIYEINAEQQFLFLRLRRVVHEFTRILSHNRIEADQSAINMMITREVVPSINNPNVVVTPTTVSVRDDEDELYDKYIGMAKEKRVHEVFDSDEEKLLDLNPSKSTGNHAANIPNGDDGLAQVSLLKPIEQRQVSKSKIGNMHTDATKYLQIDMEDDIPIHIQKVPASNDNNNEAEKEPIQLPVSKNVKMSRLNLRQVLKKVRSGNMGTTAAQPQHPDQQPQQQQKQPQHKEQQQKSVSVSKSTRSSSSPTETTGTTSTATATTQTKTRSSTSPPAGAHKKTEVKAKNSRNSAAASGTTKSNEVSSSSDDSNQGRDLLLPTEEEEHRTLPQHYDQDIFLRLFNLYTPDIVAQLQQRRSKRKRRCVHSNERADFHYGNNKIANGEDQKKKVKAFLLSPQVKRGLQAKRPKRGSADKIDDVIEVRSSSSSPIEKLQTCNECLKEAASLDECFDCKEFYHSTCHKLDERCKGAEIVSKLCPKCKRAKLAAIKKDVEEQFLNLHGAARELEIKLANEKTRREHLQLEGKIYKTQMNNLFNIVKTIKVDDPN